ncbi:hypothetical protein [Novosphingobium pentaromativorans]|uniref:Uncharacterized protein n=1 Tax=Novosphingobium pentaromativorans US6-1 TaxID=1088721 RepID=G6E8U1_9SPHN|nr:hypothetical protein [Novosphingobium pentaromativorans]EHJ62165.1 hypothetical protein NSU_0762 [Novosphingobium pentaromativorans US6-1]
MLDHLQDLEPQAPAPLDEAEVTLYWPMSGTFMSEEARTLNRSEKEAAKFGTSEQTLSVFPRDL